MAGSVHTPPTGSVLSLPALADPNGTPPVGPELTRANRTGAHLPRIRPMCPGPDPAEMGASGRIQTAPGQPIHAGMALARRGLNAPGWTALRTMLRGIVAAALLAAPVSAEGSSGARSAHVNYVLRCAGCHGMTGEGTEMGGVPTFLDSISALAADDGGRSYIAHVPGINSADLSPAEIAAVLNYVVAEWGDPATDVPVFTEDEIARRHAEPMRDIVAARREVADRLAAEGKTTAPYPWP